MIREAYEQAADLFVETVAKVDGDQWNEVALGEWTVRDLTGHTNRALLTVETYLDRPAETVDIHRPVDYFQRAMASIGDPTEVSARGREAGAALGPDPVSTVRETVARVMARVNQTPDTASLSTPVGGMQLIDYLPTRIFELTIHTLDLAAAIGAEAPLAHQPAAVTMQVVADMALVRGKASTMLLAATGRGALPAGFSILGG